MEEKKVMANKDKRFVFVSFIVVLVLVLLTGFFAYRCFSLEKEIEIKNVN